MQIGIEKDFKILYKYIKSQYVSSALEDGVFRIGTFVDYRNYEHAEIGDAEEGMLGIELPSYAVERSQCLPELFRKFPELEKLKPHLQAFENQDDVLTMVQVTVPDCYVFCMTTEFSETVMRQFDCDACIEITSPIDFFKALSRTMAERAHFAAIYECKYVEHRNVPWDKQITNMIQSIKPQRLQHQKEVRITWDPIYDIGLDSTTHKIAPFNLQCKEAAQYCRLF